MDRVRCEDCGQADVVLSLARPHARTTRRLERRLFRLTRDMTVSAVADLLDLDWDTVKDAEVRHIRGLLRKRKLEGITRVGIDEVSYLRRHRYLTLVTDLDHHRVIFVTQNRDGKAVGRFLRWFGPKRSRKLRVVVTDMHDPYVAVVRKRLPKAKLVYDHFHVSKLLHDALDEIRRRIQRQLPERDRKIIKGKRYVLLRGNERLTDAQRVSLGELLAVNVDLMAAYVLKEAFRDVYRARSKAVGSRRPRDWKKQVEEANVPELLAALRTIIRRRNGILNFFDHRVANGMSEGFNNVVGALRKQAYGFRDREYLRLKILRICGKLDPLDSRGR
jgi:transposase